MDVMEILRILGRVWMSLNKQKLNPNRMEALFAYSYYGLIMALMLSFVAFSLKDVYDMGVLQH